MISEAASLDRLLHYNLLWPLHHSVYKCNPNPYRHEFSWHAWRMGFQFWERKIARKLILYGYYLKFDFYVL